MDISVSIALILAFTASTYATFSHTGDVYFDSVCMFTFFLLLGRYLERRARYQNFKATAQYSALLPLMVERWFDGAVEQVPLKQIRPGDYIVVQYAYIEEQARGR
jgi:Cu2+-exporting ATPase